MNSNSPAQSFTLSLSHPRHPHEPPPRSPVEDPPPSSSFTQFRSQTATPAAPVSDPGDPITPIWACAECSTVKTPVRRSGPQGPASLCNACGLRLAKKRRAVAGGRVGRKRTPRKAPKKNKDGRKGKNNAAAQKRVQAAAAAPGEAEGAATARKEEAVELQKQQQAEHQRVQQDQVPEQERRNHMEQERNKHMEQERCKEMDRDHQHHVLQQQQHERPPPMQQRHLQSDQPNPQVDVSPPNTAAYANQPRLTQEAPAPSRIPHMSPAAMSAPQCAQATQYKSEDMDLVLPAPTAPEHGQVSNGTMSGFVVASATDAAQCQAFVAPNDLQWHSSPSVSQSAGQNCTPTRPAAAAVAAAAAHAAAVAASSASRSVVLSRSSISPGPMFSSASANASIGPAYLAHASQARALVDSSACPSVSDGVFPSCLSLEQLSQQLGLSTEAGSETPVFTDDDSALEAIAGGLDGAFSPGQGFLSVDPFVAERKDPTVHRCLEEVLAHISEQELRLHRVQELQGQLSFDGTMRAVVEQAQREVETLRYTGRRTIAMVRGVASTLRME